MRASADEPRNRRSASTLPVTNSKRPSASRRQHRVERARHHLAPGEVDHQRHGDPLEHLAQGRDAHVALAERRHLGQVQVAHRGAHAPQPLSDWSCSTTIAPSRVRRRSSSTMSAPSATAAAKAGSVFSRWPTGSPRWAMAATLRAARVDGPRHVGDDLVERRLDEVVHRRLGDVHPVGRPGHDPVDRRG